MGKKCSIQNCGKYQENSINISFHKLPSNKEVCTKWLAAISPYIKKTPKEIYICSEHFTENNYQPESMKLSKRILKKSAIPTIFNNSNISKNQEDNKKHEDVLRDTDFTSNSNKLEDCFAEEISTSNIAPSVSPSNICPTQEIEMIDIGVQAQLTNSISAAVQVSPKRLRQSERELQLKKENRILKKRLFRRTERITSMKSLIKYLANNKHDTEGVTELLKTNFNGFSFQVLKNKLKNNRVSACRRRYSTSIKQFAFTLFFYSPRAYEFVRSQLYLPHNSMFRKWLSHTNLQPGFLTEIFTYLENEAHTKDYLKNVSLVFDSMSIRKKLVYDKLSDKIRGYVDYGSIPTEDSEELATEVLVQLIVSYTVKFKCPIAFFYK